MGDLPDDVRTAFMKSEAKERELLASLLLNQPTHTKGHLVGNL